MKDAYRALCEQDPSIPLFQQAWWLDAVAGEGWDVVLSMQQEQIVGALPFVVRKKFGLTRITQPRLTQNLGPWVKLTAGKSGKRLSQENRIIDDLFAQLPAYHHYAQGWHFSRTNWLSCYWKGFAQTTRYTYRINDTSDLDAIWSGFQPTTRTNIKKARKNTGLNVRTDAGIDEFVDLHEMVFRRQGKQPPHSRAFLRQMDAAAHALGNRQILIAADDEGRKHSGVYLVWDHGTVYYLMGGSDPDLRNSGAQSLCFDEALKLAHGMEKSFDFEGSMIEPIERYFRSFGAEQTPYFRVSHLNMRIPFLKKLAGLVS